MLASLLRKGFASFRRCVLSRRDGQAQSEREKRPHIKLHSFVVFEPKVGFQNMMFELDGQLFHDAQFMLYKAREAQGTATSQRDIAPTRHRVLHTLLRSIVTALFRGVATRWRTLAYVQFSKNTLT